MNAPKANAVLVEALGSSLRRGGNALEDVPGLLTRILVEEAWREFVTPRGELVRHERFVDFVTTPPTAGLGATMRLIEKIVDSIDDEAERSQAQNLLDQARQGRQGARSDLGNIVTEVRRPEGNSKAKAHRRLRKDRPDLHDEVLAGRISAHAAMVQAGFRPKTLSVPTSRPDSIAAALRRHLSPDDIARLIKLLLEEP